MGAPDLDIDLYSDDALRNPWPVVEQLRSEGPVVWAGSMQRWAVTSDRLVRRLLLNFDRFTVEDRGGGPKLFGPDAFIGIDDKARHDALRGVWSVAFQRATLTRLQDVIGDIADRMIDDMEPFLRAGKSVEAMGALCRDLPAYVIAYMLGVPADMRPKIVEWSDLMGAAVGFPPSEWTSRNPAWVAADAARESLAQYILDQIAFRRRNPGDDLISQIVHSEIGRTLTDNAIMENSRQLLFAGNETTAKWLGHCMVVLAQFPDVRRQVCADRDLLPAALEEVMRWQPVVGTTFRTLRGGDLEVEGVQIANGDKIMVMTGAANRDPERYEDPGAFDIHREPKANLGFGFGMHSCLGVTLARLETQITIGRVLDRFPDFELAGDVPYSSFQLRGPKAVPIVLN
jgi:cytochrome P450